MPWDGRSEGEIVIRSNTVMKGYHKDPLATEDAFKDGFFHSGDLAVRHPDGYIEIKDRLKDVIISGGENIFVSRGRKYAVSDSGCCMCSCCRQRGR